MSDYRYFIGERIKSLRGKVTQDSLCERIEEITGKRPKRSTLSSWEKGKTCPNLDQLYALAEIFDVDMSYLLGDSDTYRIEYDAAAINYGLSENALNILRNLNYAGYTDRLEIISDMIESEYALPESSTRPSVIVTNPGYEAHAEAIESRAELPYFIFRSLENLCNMDFGIAEEDGVYGTVKTADKNKSKVIFRISDLFNGEFMNLYNELRRYVANKRKRKGLPNYR